MLLKIKTFGFRKKLYEIREKKIDHKIVHLKKICKFTLEHLLTSHVVLVLIVKNVIKNGKFYLAPNPSKNTKKMSREKMSRFEKICNLDFNYFLINPSKIQVSRQNIRYESNVRKQKCSFKKDPQLWFRTFFHRNYIFCLLVKNTIENRKKNPF